MDLYFARGERSEPHEPKTAGGRKRSPGAAGALHLCFDWESCAALRRLGLDASAWEDHIPEDQASSAARETEALCDAWYRLEDRDFTVFEGVSLGKAYRFIMLGLTVRPAAKFLLAAGAAVERHGPRTIWCETSVPKLHQGLLRSLAARRPGCRIELVSRRAASREVLAWKLPDMRLSRPKRAALQALNVLARARSVTLGPRPVLVASYYFSLDNFIRLLAEDPGAFRCLLVDTPNKEKLDLVVRAGAELALDHRREPAFSQSQRESLARMREDWRLAREDRSYRDKLSFRGTPLWPSIEGVLEDFFRTQAEPLAWAAASLDELWRRERPSAALLPYDEIPLQHLVSDIARKHGTPSVVALHGLPDYLPPPFAGGTSPVFSAWGPTLASLCAAPGAWGDRTCLAIGNPHFDGHLRLRRPAPPKEVRTILVLSCPPRNWIMLASESEPQTYATTVCEALRAANARVVFKLHPCESLSYYLRLLKDFDRIEIIKDKPIMECMLEADMVIGPFSTALIEAIILNKPILLAKLTRTPLSPPFDGSWGIKPLSSGDEIHAAVTRLLRHPEEAIADACRPYARILEEFVGPADGRASRRLLTALRRLALDGSAAVEPGDAAAVDA
ncbi:MAG: hypothetical protein HY748_08770 [Elusimicrobia bacterium]|nr:hypothetical protein [Elusimicrobiota bacterium]